MKLSELIGQTRPVEAVVGAGTINLQVRTQAITTNMLTTYAKLKGPVEGTEAIVARAHTLAEFLCEIVESWDLTENDGTPTALTPERLADLPIALLMACIQASTGSLGEAPAPQPLRKRASGAGSSTRR